MLFRSVKKITTIFLVIFIVGIVGLGFVNSLWMMGIIVIILFLIGDTISFILNSILVNNWFPKRSGMVMGWTTMAYPLSGAVATILLISFMAIGGIHTTYLPIAILAAIALIILIIFLKDYPEQCGCFPDNDPTEIREDASHLEKEASGVWTTKRVLSTKEFWFVSLSIALMMFSSGFMTQITPALLSLGFDINLLIPVMIGIAVVACIGSYLIGVLDMKLGTKWATVIVDIALFIMGILVLTNSLPCVMVAFGFLGVVMGGGSNLLVSYVGGLWGKHFTHVFRFAQPICSFFGAIAMYIIAVVSEAFGGYKASFVLASILAVISAILILLVNPKNVEKKTEKFEAEAVTE